jgi:hypothetical protein
VKVPDKLLPTTRTGMMTAIQASDYLPEYRAAIDAAVGRGESYDEAPLKYGREVIQAHAEYFLPKLQAEFKARQQERDALAAKAEKQQTYRKVLVTAEDVDEIDYYIDPAEYNGQAVPITEQIEWVAAHIDNPGVAHKDAPNTAAWSMLMHYRPSRKRREDFWNKMFPKVLTSRAAKEEQEAAKAEVLASDAAMEACEQFLLLTAQGG